MYFFESLHNIVQTYLPANEIDVIKQAFIVAKNAHEGQTRSSGEPYITHPVAVASIIAEMRLDHEAVIAALLHDVIEDTPYTQAQLAVEFGESVAQIVEGVSKLDKLKFRTRQEAEVANFRKMILAMTQDIRVVLIKLADRTHNMRTLGALRPDKRRRIAKETIEIYSPLAHRLGIEHIKNELEDLGFEAMFPHRYNILKLAIQAARGNRQELILQITTEIKKRLDEVGIKARVYGREKHLYSVYQKMRQKDQKFESILDIYAFRIVVNEVDNCYRVLGQMHSLYKPRPHRVKDYIAVPKANGYQSLHSSMIGPHGVPVEVQIRTEDMDQMAEMGVAAYWGYEQGNNTTVRLKAQRWLQTLLELQQSAGNSFEFIENVKSDLFPDEIYVFTPRGRIVELPANATAIDFAYAVHTDIGNHCIGAIVDRMPYPLSQPLKSGQTIEIQTDPHKFPNSAWLNFVVSARARAGIRQMLKNQKQNQALSQGRDQLSIAMNLQNLSDIKPHALNILLQELKFTNLEELLIEIGLGRQMTRTIAQRLLALTAQQNKESISIVNYDNGENEYSDKSHYLNRKWNISPYENIDLEAEIVVDILNQQGVLAALTSAIATLDSNILSIHSQIAKDNMYQISLRISASNQSHLETILRKLITINGVIKATKK